MAQDGFFHRILSWFPNEESDSSEGIDFTLTLSLHKVYYKIIAVEAIENDFLDQLSHEMQETEVPIMIVEEESPRAVKLNLDTQLGQRTRSSPESSDVAIRMIRM